jgi:RNA polymerase sigma-70 factor (ECF subfamily)
MTAGSRTFSRAYIELLRQARRAARRPDEAEDLLQTILLAAVEAGRADLSSHENRRWLEGALRRRATFDARSAIRRRHRETLCAPAEAAMPAEQTDFPLRFVGSLPPALRSTALLVLTGHTRQEIIWLLACTEPAFRQRIADIRRRWRQAGGDCFDEIPGLSGILEFGRMRRALLGAARRDGAFLASHDPDGHLFIVARSQNPTARQQKDGATEAKE